MFGAIIGDVVGSRFEFRKGNIRKDFELFHKDCRFTDDTVMTVAIADALYQSYTNSVDEMQEYMIDAMRAWGKKYPHAGYGRRFKEWLKKDNPHPYYSYGNGAAMRCSFCGWIKETLDETVALAQYSAEITHNHPEGIKGAQCVAAVIFLARNGKSKQEIKEYVEEDFGYDLSKTLRELKEAERNDVSCMDALPLALTAFMEGESFEEVIRNAVWLGGDTDTIAAIAGSMAEAMYEIPMYMLENVMNYLPVDIWTTALRYTEAVYVLEDARDPNPEYFKNIDIAYKIEDLYRNKDEKDNEQYYSNIYDAIIERMAEGGLVPVPVIDPADLFEERQIFDMTIEEYKECEETGYLALDPLNLVEDDTEWIPLFTNSKQCKNSMMSKTVISMKIEDLIKITLEKENVSGVIVNPFGKRVFINKEVLKEILLRVKVARGVQLN
ncbi:MAG: ADP-ribosylglycohydrolase family protein [Erysipelotrichaceae bacterium]|nr:ADP-ribosylglycohydrolase family protein [Erysipelotrichaceae bacterium]